MTGPRDRHVEFEELISSSLQGDLTEDERRRLDAHLDDCTACRATLAAFSDQRRIMAGLRHVGPPRDLHARVRTGIESGRFAPLPWWRRPATMFAGVGGALAVVAGALLAVVLLGDPDPLVGDATPTPVATVGDSETPSPTMGFPTGPTPGPTASIAPSPEPTEPEPTPEPPTPSPEPDLYLAYTGPFDNLALTVRDGVTGETLNELDTPSGPPIAAALSPDGQWLAYITPVGESGTHEVRATRVAEGVPGDPDALPPDDSPIQVWETVVLGTSTSGDPFVERLAWTSPRGHYLAYALTDPETGGTDVWIFEPSLGEPYRLTDTGNVYAGSWIPGAEAGSSFLWVSTAGEQPGSHLWYFHDSAMGPGREPIDPTQDPMATVDGVFQPLLNADGRFALYWNGVMEQAGDGWAFTTGGQPYLAEHLTESEAFGFTSERPVFTDLSIGREAFASAVMAWGEDGDSYAVWNVRWTGPVQSGSEEDPYPDETRVYFSRATDDRGMTRVHAIDRDDIPEGSSVVDVKISPTGQHLVITALRPVGGVLEAPTADLLLVERNTGDERDEVQVIRAADDGWFGPAAFDRLWETADQP